MPLLQLEFLNALLELLVKSNQERDLLDQIVELSCGLLVTHGHVFSEVFKRDHDFVERVSL